MDFLTNLVSVGIRILLVLLIIGSLLVAMLVGFSIGDSKGHPNVGFFTAMLIWEWLAMAFLASTEFETWIGSII